jgi:hypothetical protein
MISIDPKHPPYVKGVKGKCGCVELVKSLQRWMKLSRHMKVGEHET